MGKFLINFWIFVNIFNFFSHTRCERIRISRINEISFHTIMYYLFSAFEMISNCWRPLG